MDFLKDILGEELFATVSKVIGEYNAKQGDAENTVKIANLASGNYVGKGKYEALEALIANKDKEITSANELIEKLKKGNKDNEVLQNQIQTHEQAIAQLQAENARLKVDNAIKVALLEAKAKDTDYLTFKLNESGDEIKLDESEKIVGWDAKLADLKTKFPAMFDAENGNGYQPLGNNGLPNGSQGATITKEQFMKMGFDERAKLKSENAKLYESLKNS